MVQVKFRSATVLSVSLGQQVLRPKIVHHHDSCSSYAIIQVALGPRSECLPSVSLHFMSLVYCVGASVCFGIF